MKFRFLAFLAALALTVTAAAGTVSASGTKSGQPPVTIMTCTNTTDSQPFDANTTWSWGGEVYSVNGQVRVTLNFQTGSAAAYVRVLNLDTLAMSSERYFDSSNYSQTFTGLAACGHYQVQIKSASIFTRTKGTANSAGL